MATRTYYITLKRLVSMLIVHSKAEFTLSWYHSQYDNVFYIYIDTTRASFVYRTTSPKELPFQVKQYLTADNEVLGCVEETYEQEEQKSTLQITDILGAIN